MGAERALRSRAWRSWLNYVKALKAQEQVVRRMLRRMAAGGLHFAFKAWLRSTQGAKELEKRWLSGGLQMSRVLRHLCATATLGAWMKWKENVACYREQRRILKRASQLMAEAGKRLMHRELAGGWGAWKTMVSRAKEQEKSMKTKMLLFMRTLQGKADLKVSHAWHMLVRNTDIIAFQADLSWDQKLLQEKSLKRTAKAVANSSLRKGWNTWRTQLATQKLARLKLGAARRTFYRLTVLSISVAWNTWASYMQQVSAEKWVRAREISWVLQKKWRAIAFRDLARSFRSWREVSMRIYSLRDRTILTRYNLFRCLSLCFKPGCLPAPRASTKVCQCGYLCSVICWHYSAQSCVAFMGPQYEGVESPRTSRATNAETHGHGRTPFRF